MIMLYKRLDNSLLDSIALADSLLRTSTAEAVQNCLLFSSL